MKYQRMKAALHIFKQRKKAKSIYPEAFFEKDIIDLSYIEDEGHYYEVFLFVPLVAEHFCGTGRMKTAADSTHYDGIAPQS